MRAAAKQGIVGLTAIGLLVVATTALAASPKKGEWGSETASRPNVSFKVTGGDSQKIKDFTGNLPACTVQLHGTIKIKDSGKFRYQGNVAELTGEEHDATIKGEFTSAKKGNLTIEVVDDFCGDKSPKLPIEYMG